MNKEPSVHELKQTWGLPAHAKMLGWLLHDPYKDEFLVKYASSPDMTGMWWGLSPETAKAFKTLKKANSVIQSLGGLLQPRLLILESRSSFLRIKLVLKTHLDS